MPGRRPLAFALAVALALAALGAVAVANHSQIARVSVGQINGNGNFGADFKGAAADGSRVFFETTERLVYGDTDNAIDVYERSAGTTKRVSVGQVNGNGDGLTDARFDGASADGTRVFFHTSEQLVSGDTDGYGLDVYERSGGTTKRVSVGEGLYGNGSGLVEFRGASADGSRVFFVTNDKLVSDDTDAVTDIYERSSGTTKRISAGQINGNGVDGLTLFEGASADGSRVFFETAEQLVGTDTNGAPDVYERSGGSTKRVSVGNGSSWFEGASADGSPVFFGTYDRLVGSDTDDAIDIYARSGGRPTRISVGQINGNGPFDAGFAAASADGTVVFFETDEQLVSADSDSFKDVYVRSAGKTTLMSAGQVSGDDAFDVAFAGATPNGSSVFFETKEKILASDTDASTDVYQRTLGSTKAPPITKPVSAGAINGNGAFDAHFRATSAGAARVFFETNEKLVAGDQDSFKDVYERNAGTTALISGGAIGGFDAIFLRASTNGSRAFFATREKLARGDTDSAQDVYEAQVVP
jgi:hypothetical protein